MNNSKQKTKGNFLGFLLNSEIPAGIRLVSVVNSALLIYFLFTFIPLSVLIFISPEETPTTYIGVIIFHVFMSIILAMSIVPAWYGKDWARKSLIVFYTLLVAYGAFWAFIGAGVFIIFAMIFIVIGSISILYLISGRSIKIYYGKKRNDKFTTISK